MGIQGKIAIKSCATCATNLLDVFVKALAREGGRLLVATWQLLSKNSWSFWKDWNFEAFELQREAIEPQSHYSIYDCNQRKV